MKYLGIDIGGTQVKAGIADDSGKILKTESYLTDDFRKNDFVKSLSKVIGEWAVKYPDMKKVGIGIPGLLHRDRMSPLFVISLPLLNNYPLVATLKKDHPALSFAIENDASLAAVGEKHFNKAISGDFIFVTLGTGVGSGAVIDGKLFNGGGNSMEIGFSVSDNNRSIQDNIGVKGIEEMIAGKYDSVRTFIDKALEGDAEALKIYKKVAIMLARSLVSAILLLDVATVVIGGGISLGFDLMKPTLMEEFKKFLPPYHYDRVNLQKATLGNQSGLLGAIALQMD